MFDKELRKTIGTRVKTRRKELKLTQDYLADKLDVNKSTIQRYESGTIDNTKKLVVEGLAKALHVSEEWLTGKTDDMKADVSSKVAVEVLDELEKVKTCLDIDVDDTGKEFSKALLLFVLREYEAFNKSLETAYQRYGRNKEMYADIAKEIGFDSAGEFNETMFLREILHTSNAFLEISELIKAYPGDSKAALARLKNLQDFYG